MLNSLQVKKVTYSNLIILFFIIFTTLAGLYSEFFRAPMKQSSKFDQYQVLYTSDLLAKTKEMILKNPLGKFHFKKLDQDDNNNPGWEIISPRKFSANLKVLQNIQSNLKKIRIRKVYEKDPINISNFSVDAPIFTLTLIDQNNHESKISFGLINSIDNSTYIMLSDQDAIYHIDAIGHEMESYDLSDFIDSRIFTFDTKQVVELQIYNGDIKKSRVRLSMKKVKGQWIGKNKEALSSTKVEQFIDNISNINSLFIIDKQTDKTREDIKKGLKRLLYTIKVKDSKANIFTYGLTNPIASMAGIKMDKYKNVLVLASNRKYPYLIPKNKIKLFSKKPKYFKTLPFKKLFY